MQDTSKHPLKQWFIISKTKYTHTQKNIDAETDYTILTSRDQYTKAQDTDNACCKLYKEQAA